MKCVLCSSSKIKKVSKSVRDSKKHSVVQCLKCSHIQLNPIPTETDEKIFYDNNLQEKNSNYFGTIKDIKRKSLMDTERRVKFLEEVIPKKSKILEIGSGYGFFLEEMKKKHYKIIGIEVSKERRQMAKKVTDVKILDVNLLKNTPNIGKFQAIVLFHVLEHISTSIIFLQQIKEMLNGNGKIIIEVPNFNDYQNRINKEYREWNFQRAHIHYFTPKMLKIVLKNAGFKKVSIKGVQRYGIENMIYWKTYRKPQMTKPSFELDNDYELIEKIYKENLEKKMICDTIIATAS